MLNSVNVSIDPISFFDVIYLVTYLPKAISVNLLVVKQSKLEHLTFPGLSMVPPITTTSFALKQVSGSSAAANAKFVKGPTATMVTVSHGDSLRMSNITK